MNWYKHAIEDEWFELYYATGGHGGPYRGLANATEAAHRLLLGHTNERAIEIRPMTSPTHGGYHSSNEGSYYIDRKDINKRVPADQMRELMPSSHEFYNEQQ